MKFRDWIGIVLVTAFITSGGYILFSLLQC